MLSSSRAPPAGRRQDRSPTSVASPGASAAAGTASDAGADVAAKHQQNHVTPPPPSKQHLMPVTKKSIHPEMEIKPSELSELLLVCGVIGSTSTRTNPRTGRTSEVFVPVTDCIKWLQDLQRVLRRDHEIYRPISLKLGSLRVVSTKLLPVVMTCRYDKPLVRTVAKILVMLTKPLSVSAKNAGRMSVDVKSGKVDER